jgi:membrane-associated phospholipid phosphatase
MNRRALQSLAAGAAVIAIASQARAAQLAPLPVSQASASTSETRAAAETPTSGDPAIRPEIAQTFEARPLATAANELVLAGTGTDQQAPTPPVPTHSGFGALVRETGIDFGAFPRRRSTWALLAIGGAAALASHPADDYVNEHIVGSKAAEHVFVAGKWLGSVYVQSGTAAGLYLIGRYALPRAPDGSRTNKVSHLGFDLIRAQIVSQALVQGIKYAARRDRPTGECCAFPSGHAATAFAAASVLERHFGGRAAWPTLAAASYVAASRLIDNRHFLSDVMFGASVGLAAGWTVVGRHGRSTFALAPTPVRGGMLVALIKVPATPSP